MATPDAQRDPVEAGGFSPETLLPGNPPEQVGTEVSDTVHQRDQFFRLDRAFYGAGTIVGIGFLVTLFGAYVVPNTATILSGTIIVIIGLIIWILAGLMMIALMLKSLKRTFSVRGKTVRRPQSGQQ